MNPTIRDAKAALGTLTVEIPTNTSDDWLVLCVTGVGLGLIGVSPSFATPSGWTILSAGEQQNASGIVSSAFIRQGGISGTVTVTANASGSEFGIICASIKDAKASSPLDFSIGNADINSTAHRGNLVSQNTSENDEMLLLFLGIKAQGDETMQINGDDMNNVVDQRSSLLYMGLQYLIQGTAGATGLFAGSSSQQTDSANLFFSLKQSQRPSAPVVVSPNGGNIISKGAAYSIQWLPSSSPLIAQSAIKYEVDYSLNNGNDWINITTTAAGATSHSWTTSGLTVGTQYLIRVRAKDETNTLFSDYDQSDAVFSVIADVAPLAPTNLRAEQPSGTTVTNANNGDAILIKGTFNDPGDVMTAFDMDWGTDGVTYPNTTSTTSSTFSKSFAASTFPAGTIYFRVRTKDNAGTAGAYGYFNFVAGPKPATPNISAPTNASPPTVPSPTVTFTSGGHTAFRYRLVQGGTTVVGLTTVVSNGVSFALPYSLANGVSYSLFVAVQNVYGVWSDEDSETFTASYSAPAQPVLTLTKNDDNGYIDAAVTNSDTPNHNLIYASDDGVTFILITPETGIPVDGTFRDHLATHGVERSYFARAVSATGLFADSDVETVTQELTAPQIHQVTKDSVAENAVVAATLFVQASREGIKPSFSTLELAGRTEQFLIFGQSIQNDIAAGVLWIHQGEDVRAKLEAMQSSGEICCYRDNNGNKIFTYLLGVPAADQIGSSDYAISLQETRHEENVASAEVTV
jgi:hypothetical protein